MPARRPGFSLVELVIVVAVCALLAGIAVPRMGRASARYQADFAAKRVAADLERARAAARLTGVVQSVTFDLTQHRYTITGTATGSTAAAVVRLTDAAPGARITAADFGGSNAAAFTRYGDPVAAGAVTVRVNNLTRTITVDAGSGRARWQ